MPSRMQNYASGQFHPWAPSQQLYYTSVASYHPVPAAMPGATHLSPQSAQFVIPTGALPSAPQQPYHEVNNAHFEPPVDGDDPWLPSENMWYGRSSPAPRAASYTAIASPEMMPHLDAAAAERAKGAASRLPHLGPTRVERSYTRHLIDAIGTPNHARFIDHARNVSTLRDWTPPRLRDLAFCIVWEVVTAPPLADLPKLASLTSMVSAGFSTAADPEPYAGYIRSYTLTTFEGWWNRDMATSLFSIDKLKARSAQTARALNLATYMGHLYAAGYLSSRDLISAACTLVAGGITHFEQLVALRDLLAPSATGLSSAPAHEQAPLSAVMREVSAKGAGLREEQSLRGTPVDSAELRTLVDKILSLGRAALAPSFTGL